MCDIFNAWGVKIVLRADSREQLMVMCLSISSLLGDTFQRNWKKSNAV